MLTQLFIAISHVLYIKNRKTYNKSSVLVLHAYILYSKRKNIYEKVLFITAGREDKTAYKTKIYLSSYLVFIQRQAEAQNSNKEFRQVTSTSILAKMSAQFIRNPAVKMASKWDFHLCVEWTRLCIAIRNSNKFTPNCEKGSKSDSAEFRIRLTTFFWLGHFNFNIFQNIFYQY